MARLTPGVIIGAARSRTINVPCSYPSGFPRLSNVIPSSSLSELGFLRLGVGTAVRTVEEYVMKAAEFDRMAKDASDPSFKKRFADMAETYRLLATERKRMLADGTLPLRSDRDGTA